MCTMYSSPPASTPARGGPLGRTAPPTRALVRPLRHQARLKPAEGDQDRVFFDLLKAGRDGDVAGSDEGQEKGKRFFPWPGELLRCTRLSPASVGAVWPDRFPDGSMGEAGWRGIRARSSSRRTSKGSERAALRRAARRDHLVPSLREEADLACAPW